MREYQLSVDGLPRLYRMHWQPQRWLKPILDFEAMSGSRMICPD